MTVRSPKSASDRAITQWWILNEEAFILDWAGRGVDPAQTRSIVRRSSGARSSPRAPSGKRPPRSPAPHLSSSWSARPGRARRPRSARPSSSSMPRVVWCSVWRRRRSPRRCCREETGVRADTIDKLLAEHRTGRPHPTFDLPPGATVIVDEAGMLATPKLAELAHLAEQKRWRVALVGDPMQFSAVGRGGMFGMLVDTHGAIELDRVHRFTNDWERAPPSSSAEATRPSLTPTSVKAGSTAAPSSRSNAPLCRRGGGTARPASVDAVDGPDRTRPSTGSTRRRNDVRIAAGRTRRRGVFRAAERGAVACRGRDRHPAQRPDDSRPTGTRWSATATPGPSPRSTTTGPSPPADQPARSSSRPNTCRPRRTRLRASPPWAHKEEPSTTPSPSSTPSPTSATSTSP